MAKKKTTGSDVPTSTAPAATRRRAAKGDDTRAETGPVPVLDRDSTSEDIHSASDMSSGPASGNGHDPSYEEIAEVAYQRYLSRGGEHGRDWDDWLEAERELRSRK
jgi:hypothetical protein